MRAYSVLTDKEGRMIMSNVEKCPVCSGKGTKKESFYTGYTGWRTHMEKDVTCRSCNGTGIIFIPEKTRGNWSHIKAPPLGE